MNNQDEKPISPLNIFLAIIIVLAVVLIILFLIFGINWHPDPLGAERLNTKVDSWEFRDKISLAVNSKNLRVCEDFSEEALRLACLTEAAPQAWSVYSDLTLCDSVSQKAFSQPVKFSGNFLFDHHSACVTFLSLGAGQDFCRKAIHPLSQASCQDILRRASQISI